MPLANFGGMHFSAAHATIKGTIGAIGALSGYVKIKMVNENGLTLDVPGGLKDTGDKFKVTWKASQ